MVILSLHLYYYLTCELVCLRFQNIFILYILLFYFIAPLWARGLKFLVFLILSQCEIDNFIITCIKLEDKYFILFVFYTVVCIRYRMIQLWFNIGYLCLLLLHPCCLYFYNLANLIHKIFNLLLVLFIYLIL